MKILNYINGEYVEPVSKKWLDNYNPSNGEVYSQIANSNSEDIETAYQAAAAAFPKWSNTTIDERSIILLKIADLIAENLDKLAEAEAKDNGKPLSLASAVDIPRASANFRFFGNAITQFASEAHESVGLNTINYTLRQPLGVVGCISPWNLPLYLFTWKIAPAIAAGNTVVAKPSEITPMTAFLLGEICTEAGLPKGVLNIVHGSGPSAGQAIVEHPNINAISFTGGTKTGEHIARTAGPMFKKLSLELGGKNPNLIFADCNYDKMLKETVRSSFANQGQICLCGSRIYVEKPIYDKIKKDFVEKVKQLKVGNPFDEDTNLGALVSKEHLEKVESYIQLAEKEGGKILFGGNRVRIKGLENGYYLEPTVIEVFDNECRVNQEEIFGPVVTIMPFKTEEEALQMANSVKYGLSATLWTTDLNRTMRISKGIESGIVWVNTWLNRDLRTPFGGMKASGLGREGGFEALKFFTEQKNVCIRYEGFDTN
ncbi:aldehyde dehydrogenase [Aequorivita viscosa]|uniref:Aminomuconate-semialdehyde/2-hydroxymuconate-6-semialdehyde dehydrogenase n=1 Tax=Aequorivita viscosa TaxID=797419 RepID=A0A1M6HWJ0_9FLAO|nr:aldehyde dehydrogenase [Aequorivita viscosa]SDW94203.1 aminomuconate-semialdehyde/2-hydroxymuconate-6-semialdehyde dehydrogenase [Aequorivita viscosa]SHJ26508.1 aminomuconate-semialdehyde/2-hydroxymuconate-6-semialdehyde dehydrogenase [Aequorivita viscosa]